MAVEASVDERIEIMEWWNDGIGCDYFCNGGEENDGKLEQWNDGKGCDYFCIFPLFHFCTNVVVSTDFDKRLHLGVVISNRH